MTGFSIVNLKDLMDELGEDRVKTILSTFICPLNVDVEYFIKQKAIEFSKQSLSRTHLIFASYKKQPVLVAYFTLSNKSILIGKNALSKSLMKRISKFATYNPAIKKSIVHAPLIGQLGKNFHNGYNKLITGDELLKITCDYVSEIQGMLGGKVVYLECEEIEKLIQFYESNGFVNFGTRKLDNDETDRFENEYLVQMLKYIR